MKIAKLITTAVAIVATAAVGAASAPTAAAAPGLTIDKFGKWERLHNGLDTTYWKVEDLKPSTETIPDYPLAGTLWESTATVKAERGTIMPVIPNFNARVINGANYRVIWQVDPSMGISAAMLPQGAQTTGKLFFDVTGPDPTIVVYTDGFTDVLIWGP